MPLCRLEKIERQENHPLLLYPTLLTLANLGSWRLHAVPLVGGLCRIQTPAAVMS